MRTQIPPSVLRSGLEEWKERAVLRLGIGFAGLGSGAQLQLPVAITTTGGFNDLDQGLGWDGL